MDVTVRSTVVYVALLVALRLSGKRHAGQLSPHDFVLMLLVSNAAQNAMVGASTSLAGGLIAISQAWCHKSARDYLRRVVRSGPS